MMYNQQQSALSQSNASPKKPGPKRKTTQQANNRVNNKQSAQFIPNPMQANGMAGQHYQQFPQSNPMYNQIGQANMQHVAQMNQQQQILAQQQMMANGSPQFSSPQTPINASPYPNK